MKKFWWAVLFGVVIALLLLAPDSNFSNQIRYLFFELQDSVVDWLERSPEHWWQIVGLLLPFLLMIGAMIGYLCTNSDRWQELFIKAFVPLLTATLALYVTVILDLGGWGK